jgi:hypothetical protein
MKGVTPQTTQPPLHGIGHPGFNLLRLPPFAALVRWSAFTGVLQVLVLGVFIALAVLGWGRYTPEGVNAKLTPRP